VIFNIFPANEIDVDSGPVKPGEDKCHAATLECQLLQCPYGVERFVDSDDCERCQCHDPCKKYSCPDETQCAVDLYRNPQTGETEFRGVCRPSELPQLSSIVGYICFVFGCF
jgi:hypothetical protein